MHKEQTLSVRQAAIERRCSLKWIRDLLYAERLAGAQKIGKEWRIPREALEKLQPRR